MGPGASGGESALQAGGPIHAPAIGYKGGVGKG